VSSSTLLAFVEAPVVVGDPDGRVAYVNPAFESLFGVQAREVRGQSLAGLFEGGMRESVLRAVADVCRTGTGARFRVRHQGVGYAGLCSPIVAEDARVGFVILLVANAAEDERVHMLQRQIHEPADELVRVFDELAIQLPLQRAPKVRALLEDGLRALSRLRKRSEELSGLLAGKPAPPRATSFDPALVLSSLTSSLGPGFEVVGARLQVHVPPELPAVRGDAERFEQALRTLLDLRAAECAAGSVVSVRARAMDREGVASVVVAVLDRHQGADEASRSPGEPLPDSVRRIVQEFGGDLRTTADPGAGRTTAIRLNAVKQ
jgi:PAS domain S-box-containing protein